MESIEVLDITGVTMGNAVLMQAIWQWSLLNGAGFLLAVMANHEKIIRILGRISRPWLDGQLLPLFGWHSV